MSIMQETCRVGSSWSRVLSSSSSRYVFGDARFASTGRLRRSCPGIAPVRRRERRGLLPSTSSRLTERQAANLDFHSPRHRQGWRVVQRGVAAKTLRKGYRPIVSIEPLTPSYFEPFCAPFVKFSNRSEKRWRSSDNFSVIASRSAAGNYPNLSRDWHSSTSLARIAKSSGCIFKNVSTISIEAVSCPASVGSGTMRNSNIPSAERGGDATCIFASLLRTPFHRWRER